jgi:hypothetical protein
MPRLYHVQPSTGPIELYAVSQAQAIAAELEGANSRLQNSRYLFGVSVKDQKPPPRLV